MKTMSYGFVTNSSTTVTVVEFPFKEIADKFKSFDYLPKLIDKLSISKQELIGAVHEYSGEYVDSYEEAKELMADIYRNNWQNLDWSTTITFRMGSDLCIYGYDEINDFIETFREIDEALYELAYRWGAKDVTSYEEHY